MRVFINNEPTEYPSGSVLATVPVLGNNSGTFGIALAVNNIVIPKKEWNQTLLQEGDRITLIKATQGG